MSGEAAIELTCFLTSFLTTLILVVILRYIFFREHLPEEIVKRRTRKSSWKISLRLWMALRILPILVYLTYYHLRVQKDFGTSEQVLLGIFVLLASLPVLFLRLRVDVMDEYTRTILERTHSISLSILLFFCITVIIPLIIEGIIVSAIVTGYFIIGGIALTVISQSLVFWILDRRGMI